MSDVKLSSVRAALSSMPWAMKYDKFEALVEIVERHASGVRLSEQEIADRIGVDASVRDIRAARATPSAKGGKVAVIPVIGAIAPHARMVNQVSSKSGTSCEEIAKAFDAAMSDPGVSAIVFDIDSPGGNVQGVPELAQKIRGARGQKPIKAIANNLCASAAYWIGTAADELWVTPSGEVGSVGAFCVHIDASEAYAKEGLKPTIIKAGKYKAEGNQFEPLTDDAKAYAQEQLDDYYAMFVGDLSAARGISASDVEKNFGQGRGVLARPAVRRGMADKVGTLDELLATFGVSRSSQRTPLAADVSDQPARAASDVSVTIHADTQPVLNALAELRAEFDTIADRNAAALVPLTLITARAPESGAVMLSIDSDSQPHEGKEHPVPDTAAPSGASAVDVNAAIVAERQRVSAITALCAEHGVDDANLRQSMVDRNLSVAEAGHEILTLKRAEQQKQTPRITGVTDRAAEQPFANLGEQLMAIVKAERSGRQAVDPRLMRIQAAASGMSEGIPSDGGFALQPEFSQEIIKRAYSTGEVLSRVNQKPVGQNSNGLKINAIDETSRVTGSRFGGVQMFWANEADTATAKKPKLRQMELVLHKLIGLWYLTDELVQDTTALSAVAQEAFSQEVTFMVEDSILNGNGAGQPLGVFNSGAVVTVAKESGQATGTINVANLSKMYGRLWSRSMGSAVWFINQDVIQQLFQLTLGNYPVYLPAGGVSASPYATIFGRPVIPIEYAASLSTQGDINLLDLSQYLLIDKGGPQQAQSIHVRFVNDETAFRIVYRVDGQPVWNSPLTPKNGSNTLSPFIQLQSR